jgi:hypothetical protein
MSEDPTQATTESEARDAEHRENLALTDARRAEEEAAKAQKAKEAAAKEQEKHLREADELREKSERVGEEADQRRAEADAAGQPRSQTYTPPHPDSGTGSFPGSDKLPEAAQRPEVLVGGAFVGAFLLARILKRIFD